MNLNQLTNYELIQQQELKDLKSEGYYLRHKKSGARILLVKNDDDNKVFSVGFRTPPEDSTGLCVHVIDNDIGLITFLKSHMI
jgi:Zn-dependent M16 (insulinase) family peptidase